MSTQYGAGPPWGPEGRAALVANEKRRPSKAAPSKTPISATGNQGSYTRPRTRVQALPFGASILDRLLAADVAALIQRNPGNLPPSSLKSATNSASAARSSKPCSAAPGEGRPPGLAPA